MTTAEKCWKIWLGKGSQEYMVEWNNLINVLRNVQMGTVAEDLIIALNNQIVPFPYAIDF